ncbi:MAG: ChaN family lipoprotein [Gemmatimonadota bacterium]|nr:ChaN family lipoprotein [Gemmatimonadota bacterium]
MNLLSRIGAGLGAVIVLLPVAASAQAPAPSYVPHRVILTKKQRVEDFETMAAELARADVVFFGEQHDDPATHRMQLALLEAIGRRRDNIVLSLEMFERDVQPLLSQYLAGQIGEDVFLAGSRPWPRYATDYRGLVELAKARGWRVIAANVPRPMASAVSRAGLGYLDTLPADRRPHAAAQLSCPENDDYAERFLATMEGMPTNHGGGPEDPAAARQTLLRIYQAQCVKDETMAESIAAAWTPGTLVVHMNGAFHSDYRLGTASRVKSRLPKGSTVEVVVGMPVDDLDFVDRKAEKKRGDWLVYVLKPVAAPK